MVKNWLGDEMRTGRWRLPMGKRDLARVQDRLMVLVETECDTAISKLYDEGVQLEVVKALLSGGDD